MENVLFICGHNSARSQMAEEFLRQLGEGEFKAESAGFEPRPVNPYVAAVMREVGVDLSHKESRDVFELYRSGRRYDYVIVVCGAEESNCPIFPGMKRRLHLAFPDPAAFRGTPQEILVRTRQLRDEIRQRVGEFITWAHEKGEQPLGPPWQVK